MAVQLWLDDVRPAPEGWYWVKTASECISLLKGVICSNLSLDHDLGDDIGAGTGYDVITWIEARVHENPLYRVPRVEIHSSNPVAVERMRQALWAIQQYKMGRR